MLYSLLTISILILLGGLIAYIGDWLGRKIGKKRVSIFGLRPKHTSILMTIITGVLITLFTLSAMMLVSKNVRTAFLGLENLLSELRTKKKVLATLKKSYTAQQNKIQEVYLLLKNKQEELDTIIGSINLRFVELKELSNSQKKLKKEIVNLDSQRSKLENENKTLEKKNRELANQWGDTQKKILYEDIIFTKNQPLAKLIISKNNSPDKLKSELEEMIQLVNKAAKAKGTTINKTSEQLFDLQYKNLLYDLKNIEDQNLILELRSASNVLKGEPLTIKFEIVSNKLVFKKGELISKFTVSQNLKKNDAEKTVRNMTEQIAYQAHLRGIIPDLETGNIPLVLPNMNKLISDCSNLTKNKVLVFYAVEDIKNSDAVKVDYKFLE